MPESFYTLNFCKKNYGVTFPMFSKVVAFYPSKVAPEAKELKDAIEAALSR